MIQRDKTEQINGGMFAINSAIFVIKPDFLNNHRIMLDIHMCVKYLYARIQEFYDDTQKENKLNE